MHSFTHAPRQVIDEATRSPIFGTYNTPLPAVDFSALELAPWRQLTQKKKWVYTAIITDEIMIGAAVVDLSYASNAFVFVSKPKAAQRRLEADFTQIAPPTFAKISHHIDAPSKASFRFLKTHIQLERAPNSPDYHFEVDVPHIRVRATLSTQDAPPPLAVIGKVPDGIVNCTEKRVLLRTTGEATVRGTRYSLHNAHGGFDYTHGLLARKTTWRWAYAMGKTRSGKRFAMNLVEGFLGEAECVLWLDDRMVRVGEGRFSYDASAPLHPWHIHTTDRTLDVTFTPGQLHAEKKNLGLIASEFVQPIGTYSGSISLEDGQKEELDSVIGVAEHQSVLW